MKKQQLIWWVCVLLLLTGCNRLPAESVVPPPDPPAAEWRGVWLSYIELDTLLQGDADAVRQRLDRVMDTVAAKGLNTVFYHVRAHGDAYYRSQVYPTANITITAEFDPLSYAIDAAHRRGLTLHAWVNPYRLGDTTPADTDGAYLWEGVWYHDPGSECARQRIVAGVRELLEKYPIDGVHLDDYFYPPGLSPEGESFESIPDGWNPGEWRRTQISALVSTLWGLCHQHGRVFGISPASSITRCREELYADVERWLRCPGYVDYLCPQIYTGFAHDTAPFEQVLTQWTALPRHRDATLYVGLALYKVGIAEDSYAGSGAREWATSHNILARQVAALRRQDGVGGFALFRYDYLDREETAREMKALEALM